MIGSTSSEQLASERNAAPHNVMHPMPHHCASPVSCAGARLMPDVKPCIFFLTVY